MLKGILRESYKNRAREQGGWVVGIWVGVRLDGCGTTDFPPDDLCHPARGGQIFCFTKITFKWLIYEGKKPMYVYVVVRIHVQ